MITEFERLGSDETRFWAKFKTSNGARMKYQEILDQLLEERKGEDLDLGPMVSSVKEFFGGDLTHPDAGCTSTYKKNGQVLTVSKNKEIVSRFRKLCSVDAGLQARWDEFKGSRV